MEPGVTLVIQGVCETVVAVKLTGPPPPVLSTTMACSRVPGVWMFAPNRSRVGIADNCAFPAETSSVTGIEMGVTELLFGTLRTMVAAYLAEPVEGALKALWFTRTVRNPGACPAVGLIVNQVGAAVPAGEPCTAAEKVTGVGAVDRIVIDCEGGASPPDTAEKEISGGDTCSS